MLNSLSRCTTRYHSRTTAINLNYLCKRYEVLGMHSWPELNYGVIIDGDAMREYFKRNNIEEGYEIDEIIRLEELYDDDVGLFRIDSDEFNHRYHIMTGSCQIDQECKPPIPYFDIGSKACILDQQEMFHFIKTTESRHTNKIIDVLKQIDPDNYKDYKIGWYLLSTTYE